VSKNSAKTVCFAVQKVITLLIELKSQMKTLAYQQLQIMAELSKNRQTVRTTLHIAIWCCAASSKFGAAAEFGEED